MTLDRSIPATKKAFSPKHFSRYQVKIALRNRARFMGVVIVMFFGYMILAAVFSLLLSSVQAGCGNAFRTDRSARDWTAFSRHRVFTSDVSPISFRDPLANTLVLALVTVFFSFLIGVPTPFP